MDDGFPLPGRGGPCIAALGGEIEPGAARTAPGAAIGLALLARQRQLEILQPDERRPGDAVIVVGRRGVPVRKALQALHEVRGRAPAWAIARSGEVRSPRLVLAPRLRSLALLSVVPEPGGVPELGGVPEPGDRKSTRLNSSHVRISYAVFCLKKKKKTHAVFQPSKHNIKNTHHLLL